VNLRKDHYRTMLLSDKKASMHSGRGFLPLHFGASVVKLRVMLAKGSINVSHYCKPGDLSVSIAENVLLSSYAWL
jgi:hypothetical protein